MKMIINKCRVLILAFMLCFPTLVMAQGFDDGIDQVEDNPTEVPLDDHLYILVAAGLAYGFVRELKRREAAKKAVIG